MRITVLDRADVAIHEDLVSALSAEGVTEAFKSLPPGKQNFIIRRITDAAKPEAREKRIQEGVIAAHQRREWVIDQDLSQCPPTYLTKDFADLQAFVKYTKAHSLGAIIQFT